jgi:two-component system, NarL family, response regulator DesR
MIRVLLAEDYDLIRNALAALLRAEVDLDVVGEVARGDEVLPACRRVRPDVVVLDIDMPGMDGLDAAAQLAEHEPNIRVVMLTNLEHPEFVRRALEQRIPGFLMKDAPAAALANAIRTVAAGGRAVASELALSAWEAADSPLTPRETEVLRRAADGADAADIGTALYLSTGTVRNYLTTAARKLNARNRVDAVRIAQESGWL